ncbi:hypothetical protein FRC07_005959 [Ceratobasidium sp. 392]|nr:hypothetical protein FRC07_005959 [Ceratobasidium sp. 392]
MPASRTTKPARVSSSKKLGSLVRKTPYPTPGARILRNGKHTRPVEAKAKDEAEIPAMVQQTPSSLSSYQVEATLTSAPLSRASTEYFSVAPSLSRASTLTGMSSFSGMSSLSGVSTLSRTFSGLSTTSSLPSSRQSSTRSTVLEFPGGPGQEHPSYGTPEDTNALTPQASMDLASWAAGRSAWTYRSSNSGLPTDDGKVPAVNYPVRMPLPFLSFSSCGSTATEVDGSKTPERKRIWDTKAKDYVPRPAGAPTKSMKSALEIGMQWAREHQDLLPLERKKGNANGAAGQIHKIYGDAQYLN